MKRFLGRLRSPFRPVDEFVTEAQIDLRDGLLEARADRIRELQQQLARTQAELATYKTREFMHTAIRHRRRLAEEKTDLTSSAVLRRRVNRGD